MLRQRNRERAVFCIAVHRGRAGLGGIGDQRIRAGRLDLGEPASDRAQRDRLLHVLGKRIVAAGIENHQPKLFCRFGRNQNAIERQRLVIDIGVALELGIDRD